MWKYLTVFCGFLLLGFAISFPAAEEAEGAETELSTSAPELEIATENASETAAAEVEKHLDDDSDDEIRAKISRNLESISSALLMDGSFGANIFAAIMQSVDKQCMLDEYKKLNIVDKIPATPESHQSRSTSNDPSKNALKTAIFTGIGFMCSSKRDAILEFTFDMILAFRPLTSGFINETNLQQYHDILICANNYAVVNGIVDPAKYEIEYELTEQNQVECKQRQIEILEEMETISNSIMSSSARRGNRDDEDGDNKEVDDCRKLVRDGSLKFGLKYIFLFQVKLNDEQQHELIEQFIADYRTNLETSMSCLAKYA